MPVVFEELASCADRSKPLSRSVFLPLRLDSSEALGVYFTTYLERDLRQLAAAAK
ncbi:hypothetical protein [Variovorax sp. J22R115]|uniref:hypothetical protein n=1 Tax=Variovorax sp. J22R115 TaxID=3053509 RepID=UPI002576C400|nr:hypothetical protein [Variovorax sp. J22R115]MDM0047725.1 hypothetical protein [Variovorax sp. J22R115]